MMPIHKGDKVRRKDFGDWQTPAAVVAIKDNHVLLLSGTGRGLFEQYIDELEIV